MRVRDRSIKAHKRTGYRRHIAQNLGEILLRYEEPFLELIEQEDGNEFKNINFGIAFIPLVHVLAKRLDGYDLNKSMDYYRLVIQKISKEIGFPVNQEPCAGRSFDNNFEWILLSDNYLKKLETLKILNPPQWFLSIKTPPSSWIKELNDSISVPLSKGDFNLMARRINDKILTTLLENIAQSNYNK